VVKKDLEAENNSISDEVKSCRKLKQVLGKGFPQGQRFGTPVGLVIFSLLLLKRKQFQAEGNSYGTEVHDALK
jgi:hypothetical protein